MVTTLDERRRRAATVRPVFAYLDSRGVRRLWLATRLGLSKQRLRSIEVGEGRIPEGFIERACQELGVPAMMIDLLAGKPSQPRRKTA